MTDGILALSAGSFSLKFSLFVTTSGADALSLVSRGEVEGSGDHPRFLAYTPTGQRLVDERLTAGAATALSHEEAVGVLPEWIEHYEAAVTLIGVGHRVVHGGTLFSVPVLVDSMVINQLEQMVALAPLHQPQNFAAIRSISRIKPDVPQVAHVLPNFLGALTEGRVVVAHLGSGASICAMRGHQSRATTTGFTALDGLPMGTRCGAIGPGVILYLLAEQRMDIPTVVDLLYHRSGLLGVSGESSDMRELLASHTEHALEAIDCSCTASGVNWGH